VTDLAKAVEKSDCDEEQIEERARKLESKTCPKCHSEMQGPKELRGLTGEIELVPIGGYAGDKIRAFYCESCGFIELYQGKKNWTEKRAP
jgi:predicted nucleic-acid-binding Zn-ribbon protein